MTSFDASGLNDVPIQVLRELRQQLGDFVLVGMAAIDLVVRTGAELRQARLTRDVDIAIEVNSGAAFVERTRGLDPVQGSSLRFGLKGVSIDILPYGDLAPDDKLVLTDTELDVSGLATAARTAISVRLSDDLEIRVASLAGLVVLKLIAWTDRGRATEDKDAKDVFLLLSASTSGHYARELWTDDDSLARNDYDPDRTGPFRLGRQIVGLFDQSLIERLRAVLSGDSGQHLRDLAPSPLAVERLDALLDGLDSTTGQP